MERNDISLHKIKRNGERKRQKPVIRGRKEVGIDSNGNRKMRSVNK